MNIRRALLTIFFLYAVFFAAFINLTAHADDVKNDINISAKWTANNSPYVITKKIKVARGVTLTINPNVIVKFSDPNSGLEVFGTLDAQGKDQNPILFTAEHSGDENPYWGRIQFTEESAEWDEASASGCILNHCIIEYGGSGQGGGAIICDSVSPLITNNIISHSKTAGIVTNSGMPNIVDNRIHDTVCGIKLNTPEGGRVENNFLINNEQGIYLESGAGNVSIKNNTVRSSSSEIYGACLGVNLFYGNNPSIFFWEQIAGQEVDLSDPHDVNPKFTAPDDLTQGSLTFQLKVADEGGLQSVDRVAITLESENHTPIARAKLAPNQAYYFEEDKITLDGSDSSDPDAPDDDIIAYAWKKTSDPNNPDDSVSLSDPNSQKCTFTAPPNVGARGKNFVFQLTVTDRGGLQSKDTVMVEVKEKKVLIAKAGSMKTKYNVGETVILDGSESTDPNSISSWLWEQIYGEYVEDIIYGDTNANFIAPQQVTWEGECLGFRLTITDDDLNKSSDIIYVNVIDPNISGYNSPPDPNNLTITGTTLVFEGYRATLYGSATDPDGDDITYLWEQVSGSEVLNASEEDDPNFSFTAPDFIKDENLTFRLTVIDEHRLKISKTFTVQFGNLPPVAHAGTDQTVEERYTVLLDGSGSFDPDDGIASYLWEQIGEPHVDLSSDTAVTPVFVAPEDLLSNEVLIFRLTVTDRGGDKDDAFISITVKPKNDSPVADAGPDQVVIVTGEPGEPPKVTLDGSASYDPDPNADIVSYLWDQLDEPETITLSDATAAYPEFEAPSLDQDGNSPHYQSLTFLLKVKDSEGLQSSDSVIINISDDPNNQMPTADAGPDQTVSVGSTVILDGSGSVDPDITSELLISKNHFINDDSEGLGNGIAISEKLGALFNVAIRENNLEKLNGNFMVRLYSWTNEDPNALDMTDNWWGTAEGTASGDEIASMIYDYDQDEYMPQVDYGSAKNAKIAGAGSDLDYPPMADAGGDQTVEPDVVVTLDGANTYDPDEIMSYTWTQTEGQTVTLYNAETKSTTFVSPWLDEDDEDIILKFKLTVTDKTGFYDTDPHEVTITITASKDEDTKRKGSGCFISTISPLPQYLIEIYKMRTD